MPLKKSAKKALKRSLKKRERNLRYLNEIKAIKKKIIKLAEARKMKEALNLLPSYYKILDKSAKVGVIKKNTASRRKSKMTKFLVKLSKKKEK